MKSLSPNTKIDFSKLLAIVHGLPNSSGAVKMRIYIYIMRTKCFLGRFVARLLLAKI